MGFIPKGLAAEDTKRLVLSQVDSDFTKTPEKFWCKNSLSKRKDCCFWHFVGSPERDDIYHPVYEYEQILLDELERTKCISCYKATGLGITEFMIRWIVWKSLTDDFFFGKEAIIVTGPNVDLAQDIIKRAKDLIRDKIDYQDAGVYEFVVNGSRIKCYPSNNIHSARGKPKISIFFGDEAAFFKIRDDSIVRTVGERYIGKSNSWVVWVSTAGEEASGFFFDIMSEKNSIYKKLEFYYEWGLKKDPKTKTSVFNKKFIDSAMEARSFAREYCGEWGSNSGDIFSAEALEGISNDDYPIKPNDDSYDRVMSLDPGFSSSNFGIVIAQRFNKIPHIVFAEDFERTSYTQILSKIKTLAKSYKIRKIRVDSSRPELIKDLRELGFDVVGFNFRVSGKEMTANASEKVAKLEVRIHPTMKRMISQLMTIKYNTKGTPDKNNHNPFDLGDAFLMCLWYYKMGGGVAKVVY